MFLGSVRFRNENTVRVVYPCINTLASKVLILEDCHQQLSCPIRVYIIKLGKYNFYYSFCVISHHTL